MDFIFLSLCQVSGPHWVRKCAMFVRALSLTDMPGKCSLYMCPLSVSVSCLALRVCLSDCATVAMHVVCWVCYFQAYVDLFLFFYLFIFVRRQRVCM